MISHLTDVDIANRDGITPLHLAAFYALPKITFLLLNRGARPNISPGLPALIAAVMNEVPSATVVKLLLDAGAEIDVYDDRGRSLFARIFLWEVCILLL
jgi:ankyrin repeat protein